MDLFETLPACCGHIEDCMWVFGWARINFDKYSLPNLVILGNSLQYRVWNLCNQLLLQLSKDHFETMHTCCEYIEDIYVNFCRRKNNIWQNYGIFDLSLQRRVASLCNQLLPGFASNQFETLHRCYKHNEDVHMIFSMKENNFWPN